MRRSVAPKSVQRSASLVPKRMLRVQAVLKLSVLPMPRAALPLQHGTITVLEPRQGVSANQLEMKPYLTIPCTARTADSAAYMHMCRYLAMFADLQRQQLQHPGSKMCFGHLISPATAPPALLASDESIQGPGGPWPRVGCVATITGVQPQDDGSLRVGYELSRRFTLLRVDKDEPYPVRSVAGRCTRQHGLLTAPTCQLAMHLQLKHPAIPMPPAFFLAANSERAALPAPAPALILDLRLHLHRCCTCACTCACTCTLNDLGPAPAPVPVLRLHERLHLHLC